MTVKPEVFKYIGTVFWIIAMIIVVILLGWLNPFQQVSAGERGLILTWGALQEDVLTEGLHFILPVRDKLERVDITIQKVEASASSASKDLQVVTTLISLNYHLDPLRIGEIFKLYRGTE